ncbi:MAG: GNAT family N-acetyltransferase [Clostridia bacterium]|nr:GNAT family N-acetyltransferase [Clostridia bacterium]
MQYSKVTCNTEDLKQLWEVVFGDTREVTNAFFEHAFFPDGCFYESADGKAVSALYLLPVTLGDKKGFYLYAAATLPAHRGKGIMGKLIKEALAYAKSVSDFVYLCPAESSLYDYYRRFGFSQTLYARFEDKNGSWCLTTAQDFATKTKSMPNTPLFSMGVYRYAVAIGCEMYENAAVRFDGRFVFSVNHTAGELKPYGMLCPLSDCDFSENIFAFLTMN